MNLFEVRCLILISLFDLLDHNERICKLDNRGVSINKAITERFESCPSFSTLMPTHDLVHVVMAVYCNIINVDL